MQSNSFEVFAGFPFFSQ